MARKLTPRQARFVDEYLVDLNATQAAIRAGYSRQTARQTAAENLSKPDIAEAITQAQAERAKRTKVDADRVLREWLEVATVDARELVQYVRTSCADCWEDGIRDDPNPKCRKCGGKGRGSVVITDTRKLSPAAAKLYAGVQVGKDGMKVLLRDRDAAWMAVARHLGMFKDSLELKGTVQVESHVSGAQAEAVLREGLRALEKGPREP